MDLRLGRCSTIWSSSRRPSAEKLWSLQSSRTSKETLASRFMKRSWVLDINIVDARDRIEAVSKRLDGPREWIRQSPARLIERAPGYTA